MHLTWPCRRRRWMLSKQSAYALERSCSTGRACRIKRGWRRGWRAEARSRARSAVLAKVRGGRKERAPARVGASEHGWMGGAMCMPRGRGRRPRPVARSQTREDHTTTPRWRARAKNCVLRRGRPVSGFGQKKEKSTTCKPSPLRRSAWSRPSRGQRSARASSPRRPRTRHWKWGG